MLTSSLKKSLLIASMFAALVGETGLASAQVIDNPPGSTFQDQGIREWNGYSRPVGTGRTAGAEATGAYKALASSAAVSRGATVRQHGAVKHNAASHVDRRITAPIYFGLARGHG
jgi:hypothetical protein